MILPLLVGAKVELFLMIVCSPFDCTFLGVSALSHVFASDASLNGGASLVLQLRRSCRRSFGGIANTKDITRI